MIARLLIADHDPGFAQLVRRCFLCRGAVVSIALDVQECMALARESAPNVIILDPKLPGGGIAPVLNWLIEESPIQPPLIVTLDGSERVELPESLLLRIDLRLPRPQSLQELMPFVERLENAEAAVQPIDSPSRVN